MDIKITDFGRVKIDDGLFRIINAKVSVDFTDNGVVDIAPPVSTEIPSDATINFTLGGVDQEITFDDMNHIVRRFCRKAIKDAARQMCEVGGDMPEDAI